MDGVTTFYTSIAEIRNFGTANEQIILQPHPDFRITDAGGANEAVSYLNRDHLASVRLITNSSGVAEQSNTYTPFGDPDTQTLQTTAIPEEHSFIGERYDTSTGLLFLNARYYDPDLGRFLQPDWWEVRIPGVGINRYTYSMNDPVNLSDPSGHITIIVHGTWGRASDWKEEGSEFYDDVADAFDEKPVIFYWSGGNNRSARENAAEALAAFIAEEMAELGNDEPLNIVSHSHGGNVVKEYSNRADAEFIDVFVGLGTPQRGDYNMNGENIGRYINVYSSHDGVQPNGGRWWLAGRAGRTDPLAGNLRIDSYPRVRGSRLLGSNLTVSHSELHDSEVWRYYVNPLFGIVAPLNWE